jgi:hypothetical protein
VLLALIASSGCAELTVEGVDDWTPRSELWLVRTTDGARRHQLVLTSIDGYCSKKRNAEQDRIDATARHEDRLAGGDGVCESTDAFYDDLADAYAGIEKKGARYLEIELDREDASNEDERTAPAAGHWEQVGGGGLGGFLATLRYFSGQYWKERAEAYTCVEPSADEPDPELWSQFLAEEKDYLQTWELSAGQADLEEGGSESWSVDVEGDIVDTTGSSIGGLEAKFDAAKCEVEVVEGG